MDIDSFTSLILSIYNNKGVYAFVRVWCVVRS